MVRTRNTSRISRLTRLNLAPWPEDALAAIELALFLSLLWADLWLLAGRPLLLALARAVAATVVVVSIWRRDPLLVFRTKGRAARRAWLESLAVTLLVAAIVVAWGLAVREPYDELGGRLLVLSPAALSIWIARSVGLTAMQQIGLQLFLLPLACRLLRKGGIAVLLVALLFGLLHLPSPTLAAATAVVAVVWMVLYLRGGRLLPLVVSHAFLVVLAASVLPPRVLYDMHVGSAASESVARSRFLARTDVRALLRSVTEPAYFDHHGGSEERWITDLYRVLFARPPAAAELEEWHERSRVASRPALVRQMLFSEELDRESLVGRRLDYTPMTACVTILPQGTAAVFDGWPTADSHRLLAGQSASIRFRLEAESERIHLLTLRLAAASSQRVEVSLNGRALGDRVFSAASPEGRFTVPVGLLSAAGDNVVRLEASEIGERVGSLSGASAASVFESLSLEPLRFPTSSVVFTDDAYFLEGFSIAEESLRWTLAPTARMVYPLRGSTSGAPGVLELKGGSLGQQEIEVLVNGRSAAHWHLEGLTPVWLRAPVDAGWLRPGANEIEFRLPEARTAEGDPRLLGLALVFVRLFTLEPSQQ